MAAHRCPLRADGTAADECECTKTGGTLWRPGCDGLGLALLGAGAEDLHDQVQPRARRPRSPITTASWPGRSASSERTKGGLKIEVFHSAQLGKEEDIIEQIRQGANIGQNTDSARMGNYVPGIAVMNGPYFAETLEEVAKLRKAPTVIKWQEELADKHGLKVVSLQLGAGLSAFLHQQAGQDPGRPQRPAHPHAARADLAGIDPRARRRAGRDGVRRDVSGPAAEGDRRRRARLQQHPGRAFYEVLKFANETKHIMLINFEVVCARSVQRPAEGVSDRAGRGMREGGRGDLEADLQARGRGRAAAQGPRHDDRRRTSISPPSARPARRPTRCSRSPTRRTPCTRRSASNRSIVRVEARASSAAEARWLGCARLLHEAHEDSTICAAEATRSPARSSS